MSDNANDNKVENNDVTADFNKNNNNAVFNYEVNEDVEEEDDYVNDLEGNDIENNIPFSNEDLSKKNGFKIKAIKFKDGNNGKVLWESSNYDISVNEKTENLPKEIAGLSVIKREIIFSTEEKLDNLELVQNFYLYGELIESHRFHFGFVIPKSDNSWEQIIEARPEEEMIPIDILSGNLRVEILFLNNSQVICRNVIKIFYV